MEKMLQYIEVEFKSVLKWTQPNFRKLSSGVKFTFSISVGSFILKVLTIGTGEIAQQ